MEENYTKWLVIGEPTRLAINLETLSKSLSRTIVVLATIALFMAISINDIVAQDLQVSIGVPNQGTEYFSICGDAESISLSIENVLADTITDVNISIPIPTGFRFVNNSLSGNVTLQDASIPSFSIDTLFPNIEKNFVFEAVADCNGAVGNDNLTATFNYTGGTGTHITNSAIFDIVEPDLSFASSSPNSLDLALHETTEITTILANTGERNT